MEPQPQLTRRLARFAAETQRVPDRVRHEAVRAITNGIATGLAGCRDAATMLAMQVAGRFSAGAEASVIGHAERFDLLHAASLNAIAINVFDFDDTDPETILHPTAPVLPVLLALSQSVPINGPDFLDAFAIGVEVECRVAYAVTIEHYRRGWHITSTCGVFGAAAAAGRILGLNKEQMLHALGIASAQAGGPVETLGTMAKSVSVGNAARNGLIAALLAKEGMIGPEQPLEGPRGFIRVTADQPDFSRLTDRLGDDWALLRNTYKPYPCGVVLNPVIEAALDLAATPGFAASEVERAIVSGHPLLADRADRANPASGREAQVSAQHAVAVSLLRRKAGLDEFSDAAVTDRENQALRAKVEVMRDAEIPVGAALLELRMRNRGRLSRRVDHARGDSHIPLTDSEIRQKLRELAAWGAPEVSVEPLIEALDRLAGSGEAVRLARLAAI